MSQKEAVNIQMIKAVILTGGYDFGRCPLASRLPVALWPVAEKSVLQRLIDDIYRQGIRTVIICSNGYGQLLQNSLNIPPDLQITFLDEPLPRGTAGCLLDALAGSNEQPFFVFQAGISARLDLAGLAKAHCNSNADMTIMFNPTCQNNGCPSPAPAFYICRHTVLEHIPKQGYFDIKEGLIPAMLRAGKTVRAAQLPRPFNHFSNWPEYLAAVGSFLQEATGEDLDLPAQKRANSQNIWISPDAQVSPSARLYGPIAVMHRAIISDRAIIFGPAIIGRAAAIGKNSLIEDSVLWDGARVGSNCRIQGSLFDRNAAAKSCSVVENRFIPDKKDGRFSNSAEKSTELVRTKISQIKPTAQLLLAGISSKLTKPAWLKGNDVSIWFGPSVLLLALLWSYRPQITDIWHIWHRSDEYSSGLLVPFLAAYVLWARRETIRNSRIQPCLWGLFAFLATQAFRYLGLFFMYASAERLSLVLACASLVLLLFGWRVLRRVWPVLAFLLLMLPLPKSMHQQITLPLQALATSSAVFCLETMGYEVVKQGNIININGTAVAVAEACNGLRMLTAFFVVSGLVVLLVRRPLWQKITVLVSGLPIALACNTMRLTLTAIALTRLTGEHWETLLHDFGGLAMMPLALAAVAWELWIFRKIAPAPKTSQCPNTSAHKCAARSNFISKRAEK